MSFTHTIAQRAASIDSCVCVGLDPDLNKLPRHLPRDAAGVTEFLLHVIDATAGIACAFKPNLAFFGALGVGGLEVLAHVRRNIPSDTPVILDFKAGDIGNTAERYADMAFDVIGADAVTVNPYMGFDAVRPFLRPGRCAFVLCLTSNKSSADLQHLPVDGRPLYTVTAEIVNRWSSHGECGLVVGATHPDELEEIRKTSPTLPFLIPGVGTQGGDAEAVVRRGSFPGGGGILINASRGILYASDGEDFADAAMKAAEDLRAATSGLPQGV
ncbi:MAG: orotidine-5'-phosphate decarboxylase [Gemmatimonadetes bacterium]|nr:orotidine-5'-phosphate decarboxylase [Gemmatimonadota bacterium]|tara:strand:- start:486 stop:1298 length:813 start_codon:yes stop_codon:yes gene_type:complete